MKINRLFSRITIYLQFGDSLNLQFGDSLNLQFIVQYSQLWKLAAYETPKSSTNEIY